MARLFHPGDTIVHHILEELDHVKATSSSVTNGSDLQRSKALIHHCARLLKTNMSDHLIATTTVWVFVSLIRLDGRLHSALLDAGVPGLLGDLLRSPHVTGAARAYSQELTTAMCSHLSTGLVQRAARPDLSLGKEPFLPGLLSPERSGSLDDSSQTLARFVPYQLNAKNFDAISSLFPNASPNKGPSYDPHSAFDSEYSRYSGCDIPSRVLEGLPSSDKIHSKLPQVLRGSGSVYRAILSTPYASEEALRVIDKSAEGKRCIRQSSTSHGRVRHASRSGSRPRTSSRFKNWGTTASGGGLDGVRTLSRHANHPRAAAVLPSVNPQRSYDVPSSTVGSSAASYDPSAVYADMTESLSKLDPLCLNLSIGLHGGPARPLTQHGTNRSGMNLSRRPNGVLTDRCNDSEGLLMHAWGVQSHNDVRNSGLSLFEDESYLTAPPQSWVSSAGAADLDQDAPSLSSSWQGKSLTHGAVFNTAPMMAAEQLIDTAFVRQLFVDGTTMEETQNLIFKLQGVFELFDKECTGVVDWDTFTKLLLSIIPDRMMRADVVEFIAAQAEDPQSSVDYREFCMSGKVIMIEMKEKERDRRSLSTVGWQHRQQAVTGDPSTYTWKNHVEWYRDRKSSSLIWLMRRASRAVLSFSRHILACDYLMYQGERARCLGFLLECGARCIAGNDMGRNVSGELSERAKHARRWMLKRDENAKVLHKIGAAAAKAVQAEYERLQRRQRRKGISGAEMATEFISGSKHSRKHDSDTSMVQKSFSLLLLGSRVEEDSDDEKEMLAAKKRMDEILALSLSRSKANPNTGYARIQERYYKTKLAIDYLRKKGVQAIRLGYNKEDAVRWLSDIGLRSCGQSRVTDKIYRYLAMKGQEAIQLSIRSDDTFIHISKFVNKAKKIYDKYLQAQRQLHKVARLALRVEEDVSFLISCGQRWLVICNARDSALVYLKHRRNGAMRLIGRQRAAVKFLQGIPQKIWMNMDRVKDAEWSLQTLGKKAISADKVCCRVALELQEIARKGTRAYEKYRQTWAHLQQVGEMARRKHFEKHWTIQSYNKPLIKEEEARIIQQDKDAFVIRRPWTRDERLRAELEDAFEFLGLKPQKPKIERASSRWELDTEDDLLAPLSSRVFSYQISKTNFSLLTINGKLLGGGAQSFNASEEFDKIDVERCGYVSFEDVWAWLKTMMDKTSDGGSQSATGGVRLLGKLSLISDSTGSSLNFCLNDILPVKERVILTLFERYEGRNSKVR